MRQLEVQVANRLGLHARAAARFVHAAQRYQARIAVSKDAARVDGKSILGLLTLAAAKGSRLLLTADGPDEEQALAELTALVAGAFGDSD